MIVDFHTHIFPDKLAARALYKLSNNIDNIYPVVTDGTVRGLLDRMDEWGIDISVVQPVLTSVSQATRPIGSSSRMASKTPSEI